MYHYPYTGGSAYVLWRQLVSSKTGIRRIQLCKKNSTIYSAILMSNGVGGISSIIERINWIELFSEFCYALTRGHLKTAQWLYMNGCDMALLYNDNYIQEIYITTIIERGHISILKWLHKINYKFVNDEIGMACYSNNLKIAKWLYSIGCDPTANDNCAIKEASYNGNLRMIKWLYSVGCELSGNSLMWACCRGHIRAVEWLCNMKRYSMADYDNAIEDTKKYNKYNNEYKIVELLEISKNNVFRDVV